MISQSYAGRSGIMVATVRGRRCSSAGDIVMKKMLFLTLILISTVSLTACSVGDNGDSNLDSIEDEPKCRNTLLGQCNWYKTCLEDSVNCGDQGYAIGYGFKYCSAFSDLSGSDKLMKWRDETMLC